MKKGLLLGILAFGIFLGGSMYPPSPDSVTYLGGSQGDHALDVAVDSSGCLYVVGYTWNPPGVASDFPVTPNAFDTEYNGAHDVFISKFDPSGTQLIYSTFLGGSGNDWASAIAVDGAGRACVVGNTQSSDFPGVNRGHHRNLQGPGDVFIAVLDASGSDLEFATYLGGSKEEVGADIALDRDGHIYVTGTTWSPDFPIYGDVIDKEFEGEAYIGDAFVAKLASHGGFFYFSTFLGGKDSDYGHGIAVDHEYRIYVTGQTYGSDYPVTTGAYDSTYNGEYEAFLTKINPWGTAVEYSTFLGGSGFEEGLAVAVDEQRRAYVGGWTLSEDFPVTDDPANLKSEFTHADAFIARLDVTGSMLENSVLLGGTAWDSISGIAIDGLGNVVASGVTESTDFPTTSNAYQPTPGGGSEAFVIQYDLAQKLLRYATYLGGSGLDLGSGIAVDAQGRICLTGDTWSPDFPVTQNAWDRSFDDRVCDAFSARFLPKLTKKKTVIR